MEIPDQILIAGIKKDDYTSYNQLFMRYYSRLCTYVFGIVQNESASEDVVQELFIRLWTQREKLIISESISGYLYRASKNSALNYLRAENNRKHILAEMPVSDLQTDEVQVEQVEFNAALHQCIQQLPGRSKEVFLLSRFDGLKQKEISDQLGISVKTIKNQIWKSFQYLDSVAATIIGKKFETQHDPKAEVWLKSGWLEVDLEASKTVSKASIQELPRGDYSPVTSFSIDYLEKGMWKTAAEGTTIGKKPFEVNLPKPVTARKFRLSIKAEGRPAIAEFQLFSSM